MEPIVYFTAEENKDHEDRLAGKICEIIGIKGGVEYLLKRNRQLETLILEDRRFFKYFTLKIIEVGVNGILKEETSDLACFIRSVK